MAASYVDIPKQLGCSKADFQAISAPNSSQCCHMKDETNFRNVGFKLAIHMNIWNYDYGIIRAWTKHGEPTQLNHNWLAALL